VDIIIHRVFSPIAYNVVLSASIYIQHWTPQQPVILFFAGCGEGGEGGGGELGITYTATGEGGGGELGITYTATAVAPGRHCQ